MDSPVGKSDRLQEVRRIVSVYSRSGPEVIVRGPLTIVEVEEELANPKNELLKREKMSFDGPEWQDLKTKLRAGDEMYFYRSDHQSWVELRGSEGYVVIRGNEIVGALVTAVN